MNGEGKRREKGRDKGEEAGNTQALYDIMSSDDPRSLVIVTSCTCDTTKVILPLLGIAEVGSLSLAWLSTQILQTLY